MAEHKIQVQQLAAGLLAQPWISRVPVLGSDQSTFNILAREASLGNEDCRFKLPDVLALLSVRAEAPALVEVAIRVRYFVACGKIVAMATQLIDGLFSADAGLANAVFARKAGVESLSEKSASECRGSSRSRHAGRAAASGCARPDGRSRQGCG